MPVAWHVHQVGQAVTATTLSDEVRELVTLRQGRPDDLAFVLDSWLQSYRDNNPEARALPRALFYSMHRRVVERLLARSLVVVACAKDNPNHILGWAAYETEPGVLHYLYVKAAYRGHDISRWLAAVVQSRGCTWLSHRTPKLERVAKALGLTLNPYLQGAL